MYDIIGDIHGCATALKRLLKKMGYQETKNGFYHPHRKVIFLGDYIDRGDEIVETLTIVRTMVETGQAIALIGNHEYNFICFHTQDSHGPLREHSDENIKQISETTNQLDAAHQKSESWVAWMKQLPLALDLPALRCIHACWDHSIIQNLKKRLGPALLLNNDFLVASAQNGKNGREKLPEYDMIETILKGPEVDLPRGVFYMDKDKRKRHSARLKWWMKPDPSKSPHEFIFTEAITNATDFIKKMNQTAKKFSINPSQKAMDRVPTFFGHYWLTPPLTPLSDYHACLDSSVIHSHVLTGYQFDGESKIQPNHFCNSV